MDFTYTGSDFLTSAEHALRNYNNWIVKQFADQFHRFRYQSALDFGAGIGSLAVLFRNRTGVAPLTLEIDATQREALKQRGFLAVSDIDLVPSVVDFVYTSNVLEHIPDDVEALSKLRERMSACGRIAIYVPAFESIWTSLDDLVGHQRRYDKWMLRQHLEAAGYQIEHMRYCDSIGFVLAALFKRIGSTSGEPSPKSLLLFDRALWPISRGFDLLTHPFFGKNIFAVARPI